MKYLHSLGVSAIAAVLGLCLSARPMLADSLSLRNGEHLHGKFAGGTEGVIAFVTEHGTQYFNVSDVLAMTFDGQETGSNDGVEATPKIPLPGQGIQPQTMRRGKSHGVAGWQVRLSRQANPQPASKPRTSS